MAQRAVIDALVTVKLHRQPKGRMRRDSEGASDLLDQLEARFPRAPAADEAALLRGYVALARCDFEAANRHFDRFIRRFEPVSDEIDRILHNVARREVLYEELIRPEGRKQGDAVHRPLVAVGPMKEFVAADAVDEPDALAVADGDDAAIERQRRRGGGGGPQPVGQDCR